MAVNYDQPLWLGAIVGIAAAAVLATVLGLPTLRLRADYLAIVTIATSEDPATGVPLDVVGQDHPLDQRHLRLRVGVLRRQPLRQRQAVFVPRVKFQGTDLWSMLIGWSIVAVLCLLVYLWPSPQPLGRVPAGCPRDGTLPGLGKNAYSFKMQA